MNFYIIFDVFVILTSFDNFQLFLTALDNFFINSKTLISNFKNPIIPHKLTISASVTPK